MSSYIGSGTKLIISVPDGTSPFTFKADAIQTLVIGRYDPATRTSPEIDLAPYGALQNGVSRRHALITWRDEGLSIIDQKSQNGTFLNGHQLVPYEARILRDSDHLRVGSLVLHIKLERQSKPQTSDTTTRQFDHSLASSIERLTSSPEFPARSPSPVH
jgi:pSer/pThr/pTyr-binding forkhead associated (FHA) protein